MKKIISLFLSLTMLLSLTAGLDFSAYAETVKGECGDNATYTFDSSTGLLTISGKGECYAPYSLESKIKSVAILDGITSIGEYAFENCESLISVTIPDSVTSIGYFAFGDCTSLTSVTIPDSVTSIGESAFGYCKSLTSVTIAKGVTSIDEDAFKHCESLTSVTIPDGITSIGDHAFYGCSKLSDVTIPKSVTKIGCGAFVNCSLLAVVIKQKKISIKSDSFDYDTVFLCDSSTGIKEANCNFTVRYIDKANKVTDFSKFNDKYEYKMDALYQWHENDKIVKRLNYFIASKTGTYYSGSNAIFDSDYNLVKSKRLNDVIDDESNHDNSGYSFQLTKGKKYYFTNGVIIKDFVYYDNGKQYIDGDISYDCLKAIFPDNKVRKFAYIANKDKLKNTQKSQFCGKSVEFKLKKPVTVKSFDVINSNQIDDNYFKNLQKQTVDNSKVTFRLNLSDSSKYTIKNSSVDSRAGEYANGEFVSHCEFNCKDGRVFYIRFGYNDNKPGKMEITINKHTKTITMNKNRKHTYKSVVTPATSKKNGKIEKKCSVCKNVASKKTIYKASKISISNKTYTYDGKAKKPTVTVKDSKGKKLSKGKDYTVSYSSGRKNVGRYAVKIKLKGNYSGTVTKTFDIVPKGTSIKKISASKKGFKVYWKAQKKNTTGYEIQYSTAKSFKNAKTVKVSKNSATSQSVAKLSGKKKYFVRVRTYKTVKYNGKKCKVHSSWSNPKTVVTKK